MYRPPPGTMVYWRFKGDKQYRFGYCSYLNSASLVRMGPWNGNTYDGPIVDCTEIEWKPYNDHLLSY